MAPLAPFYAERLYTDLNKAPKSKNSLSVHLTDFPGFNNELIDKQLEERMSLAQKISSMVLGLRRKVNIKVRQPLNQLMIPVLGEGFQEQVMAVEELILSEINVKEIEFIQDSSDVLVQKIRPNFKSLGPRYGKLMKKIADAVQQMSQEDITSFKKEGEFTLNVEEQQVTLTPGDAEITTEDIPGWLVASEGPLTVALDVTVTDTLRFEGIAREFINRIQNFRKESGFDVTDKIDVQIKKHGYINKAIEKHKNYIGTQTLAGKISLVNDLDRENAKIVELEDGILTWIRIDRIT
jgi:isoleucyl-tRNA synthetase